MVYIPAFEQVWKEYPFPVGKKQAYRHFKASIKTIHDLEALKQALVNYKAHLSKHAWKSAQNGKTWFNNWEDWKTMPETPEEKKKRLWRETEKERIDKINEKNTKQAKERAEYMKRRDSIDFSVLTEFVAKHKRAITPQEKIGA